MPQREIVLTEHFDAMIDAGVRDGRYRDADEAVAQGLRLLEEQEAEDRVKLEWLRAAIQQGLDSLERGESRTFTSMDEVSSHIRQLGREAADAVRAKKLAA